MRGSTYELTADWSRFEQGEFDELMALLFSRKHKDAEKVEQPSDSGGDGGRDLFVVEDGRRIIYQFKFWTGHVAKTHGRPGQIERSFIAALAHEPDEWKLVVPAKLKDEVRQFVHRLPERPKVQAAGADASRVVIKIVDELALNALVVDDPEALNLIRDRSTEMEDFWRHAAVANFTRFGDQADVDEAMTSVEARVDTGSAHWGAALERRGGRSVLVPTPKHPHAQSLEPISRTFNIEFPASTEEDRDLAWRFRNLVEYGDPGPVLIPRSYLKQVGYSGPEIFRASGDLDDLVLEATEVAVEVEQFVIETSRGADLPSRIETMPPRVTRGSKGVTLTFDCSPGFTVAVRWEGEEPKSASFSYTLSLEGLRLRDFAAAVEHAISVRETETIRLITVGGVVAELSRDGVAGPENLDEKTDLSLRELHALASDLLAIAERLGVPLSVPDAVTVRDLAVLRSMRLVLEGKVAPFAPNGVTLQLDPEAEAPAIEATSPAGSGRPMFWRSEASPRIEIGPVAFTMPTLFFTHPEARIARMSDDGRTIVVRPPAGGTFAVYSPELLTDKSGVVARWDLPGVEELHVPQLTFATRSEDGALRENAPES